MGGKRVQVRSRVWFTRDGEPFLGGGRVDLLERIGETGSISEAARRQRISYKKAWEMIEAMNRLSQKPLVERSAGGRGGGGTVLTAYGRRMVEVFRTIDERCKKYVDGLFDQIAS